MISGAMLSAHLESKQKDFEERYNKIFNVNDKVISLGLAFFIVSASA
jgi:mannosyl-oligosaccharide glucosidase